MASTPGRQTADPTTVDDSDRLTAALAAAQAGNQLAFTTLYHDLHPRLLRQLRFLVGSADAPDVAADTWLHIVIGITAFRGGYRNFRSWTTTIAQRRAVDHLRRTSPTDPTNPADLPDRPAPDDTERDALEALATLAVLTMIKGLTREQGKIVLLRVIVGFDAPTAARILGIRPGAIRTGTHRALRTLAGRLPQPAPASPAQGRARRHS